MTKFEDGELELINSARTRATWINICRVCLLMLLLCCVAFMMADYLSVLGFAFLSLAVAVFALLLPQLGPGPKYEDLTALLIQKVSE